MHLEIYESVVFNHVLGIGNFPEIAAAFHLQDSSNRNFKRVGKLKDDLV
jgi:hypothetical protein